jgi:hypothetical protein
MKYSLKLLFLVFAFVAAYLSGLSHGAMYKIMDDAFVRQQLEIERFENLKLKDENQKLTIALDNATQG